MLKERYIPCVWTSATARGPVMDLRGVKSGTLLIPASWNGGSVLTVYVYEQTPASQVDHAPTGSGLPLSTVDGTAVEILGIAASTAIQLPEGHPIFDARYVAFNAPSTAHTTGLTWYIDAKVDL